MNNLLLMTSIVLNIFLIIHQIRMKNYIKNKMKKNNDAINFTRSTLDHSITKLSDNMDRHFLGLAGKVHMLSGLLNTENESKRKK